MVFNNLLGPQGSILTTLNNFIPGISIYLVVMAVFIFILAAFRGKGFDEKKGESTTYLIITSLIIFVVTANMFFVIAVVIIFLVVQGTEHFAKLRTEYGSRGEREAAASVGVSQSEYRKLIRRMKRMEKEKGSDALSKAAAKSENALAEEAERQAEVELHEAAIAGCLGKISGTVIDLQNRELSIEKRNQQIGATITAIDQQLSQMSDRAAMDDAGVKYLTQSAGQLVTNLGELIKDKKYEDQYRKKAVEEFKKGLRLIEQATRHAGKAEGRSKHVEKQLGKLAIIEIATVEAEIKKEEKRLKSLEARTADAKGAVKKSIDRQIAKVEKRIGFLQKERKKLAQMAAILEGSVKKQKQAIKFLLQQMASMRAEEKETRKKEKEIENFEKEFKKIILHMKNAQTKFSEEISSLETEAPEEVAIKTTANIGEIYTKLLEVAKKATVFNTDELKPFIGNLIEITKKIKTIVRSSYFIEFFLIRLTEAFKELNQMAAAVAKSQKAKNKLQTEFEKEKVQEDLDRYVADKGKKIFQELEEILKRFESALPLIDEHINYLKKEYAETEVEEKATLAAIEGFTNTLMKHKKRVHKEFMDDAARYSARFQQAKKAAAAARSFSQAA